MSRWPKGFRHKRVRCSCGQMIADINPALHRRGVRHRRYKLVVRLLNSDCVTYSEIADRVGVSRERIRQIAGTATNKTSRERRGSCHVSRAFLRWRAHPNTQLLLQHELPVRPMMLKRANRRYALPSTRMFRIDGKKVLVKQAWAATNLPGCVVRIGFSNPKMLEMVDFVVSHSPYGAYIFPSRDYPYRGTCFVAGDRRKYGTRNDRHDWPKYREAWHLLKPLS